MIDALALPFMQRALAAGLLVGLAASLLGVLVILRRAAFFGDAIAHASLAGVALGVVAGAPPLLAATAVAVGIGFALPRLERRARLSLDALLGFVLPFFMALGVLILSAVPGYQPDLLSYLFGSLLTVSRERVALVAGIAVLVTGVVLSRRRQLTFAVFDPDGAKVAGIRVDALMTLYHVLLALAVVASISTAGIVLANALLVIPAATAKLLARSLGQMFWLAPLVGAVSVVAGLGLAYRLDLPSGPAIVVVAGLAFLAAWGASARRGPRPRTR